MESNEVKYDQLEAGKPQKSWSQIESSFIFEKGVKIHYNEKTVELEAEKYFKLSVNAFPKPESIPRVYPIAPAPMLAMMSFFGQVRLVSNPDSSDKGDIRAFVAGFTPDKYVKEIFDGKGSDEPKKKALALLLLATRYGNPAGQMWFLMTKNEIFAMVELPAKPDAGIPMLKNLLMVPPVEFGNGAGGLSYESFRTLSNAWKTSTLYDKKIDKLQEFSLMAEDAPSGIVGNILLAWWQIERNIRSSFAPIRIEDLAMLDAASMTETETEALKHLLHDYEFNGFKDYNTADAMLDNFKTTLNAAVEKGNLTVDKLKNVLGSIEAFLPPGDSALTWVLEQSKAPKRTRKLATPVIGSILNRSSSEEKSDEASDPLDDDESRSSDSLDYPQKDLEDSRKGKWSSSNIKENILPLILEKESSYFSLLVEKRSDVIRNPSSIDFAHVVDDDVLQTFENDFSRIIKDSELTPPEWFIYWPLQDGSNVGDDTVLNWLFEAYLHPSIRLFLYAARNGLFNTVRAIGEHLKSIKPEGLSEKVKQLKAYLTQTSRSKTKIKNEIPPVVQDIIAYNILRGYLQRKSARGVVQPPGIGKDNTNTSFGRLYGKFRKGYWCTLFAIETSDYQVLLDVIEDNKKNEEEVFKFVATPYTNASESVDPPIDIELYAYRVAAQHLGKLLGPIDRDRQLANENLNQMIDGSQKVAARILQPILNRTESARREGILGLFKSLMLSKLGRDISEVPSLSIDVAPSVSQPSKPQQWVEPSSVTMQNGAQRFERVDSGITLQSPSLLPEGGEQIILGLRQRIDRATALRSNERENEDADQKPIDLKVAILMQDTVEIATAGTMDVEKMKKEVEHFRQEYFVSFKRASNLLYNQKIEKDIKELYARDFLPGNFEDRQVTIWILQSAQEYAGVFLQQKLRRMTAISINTMGMPLAAARLVLFQYLAIVFLSLEMDNPKKWSKLFLDAILGLSYEDMQRGKNIVLDDEESDKDDANESREEEVSKNRLADIVSQAGLAAIPYSFVDPELVITYLDAKTIKQTQRQTLADRLVELVLSVESTDSVQQPIDPKLFSVDVKDFVSFETLLSKLALYIAKQRRWKGREERAIIRDYFAGTDRCNKFGYLAGSPLLSERKGADLQKDKLETAIRSLLSPKEKKNSKEALVKRWRLLQKQEREKERELNHPSAEQMLAELKESRPGIEELKRLKELSELEDVESPQKTSEEDEFKRLQEKRLLDSLPFAEGIQTKMLDVYNADDDDDEYAELRRDVKARNKRIEKNRKRAGDDDEDLKYDEDYPMDDSVQEDGSVPNNQKKRNEKSVPFDLKKRNEKSEDFYLEFKFPKWVKELQDKQNYFGFGNFPTKAHMVRRYADMMETPERSELVPLLEDLYRTGFYLGEGDFNISGPESRIENFILDGLVGDWRDIDAGLNRSIEEDEDEDDDGSSQVIDQSERLVTLAIGRFLPLFYQTFTKKYALASFGLDKKIQSKTDRLPLWATSALSWNDGLLFRATKNSLDNLDQQTREGVSLLEKRSKIDFLTYFHRYYSSKFSIFEDTEWKIDSARLEELTTPETSQKVKNVLIPSPYRGALYGIVAKTIPVRDASIGQLSIPYELDLFGQEVIEYDPVKLQFGKATELHLVEQDVWLMIRRETLRIFVEILKSDAVGIKIPTDKYNAKDERDKILNPPQLYKLGLELITYYFAVDIYDYVYKSNLRFESNRVRTLVVALRTLFSLAYRILFILDEDREPGRSFIIKSDTAYLAFVDLANRFKNEIQGLVENLDKENDKSEGLSALYDFDAARGKKRFAELSRLESSEDYDNLRKLIDTENLDDIEDPGPDPDLDLEDLDLDLDLDLELDLSEEE